MRTLIAAFLACMALNAHAQLDTSGNLAADWNLGGHVISNGVFVGDGSGLTGISGGGGAPKTLGGQAQNWSILSDQASNVTYVTQEGITYLNFDTYYAGGTYVDNKTLLASNVSFNALYLYGRAYGATGSVYVATSIGDGATNTWHMTTNLSYHILPLSGGWTELQAGTISLGILTNSGVSDARIQAATIQGSWQ